MNILQKVSIRNLNLLAVRKIPPDADIVFRHKKDLKGVSLELIKEAGLSDIALETYFENDPEFSPVTETVTIAQPDPVAKTMVKAETDIVKEPIEKTGSRKPRTKGV
ncbi:MAG: hypothetical protein ACRDBG_26050 [Waterburya sp.]